jgi:hypothetical protein
MNKIMLYYSLASLLQSTSSSTYQGISFALLITKTDLKVSELLAKMAHKRFFN